MSDTAPTTDEPQVEATPSDDIDPFQMHAQILSAMQAIGAEVAAEQAEAHTVESITTAYQNYVQQYTDTFAKSWQADMQIYQAEIDNWQAEVAKAKAALPNAIAAATSAVSAAASNRGSGAVSSGSAPLSVDHLQALKDRLTGIKDEVVAKAPKTVSRKKAPKTPPSQE